ncbi:hypothetical protein [Roseimaritima multifibrata]|uniref:hypothetical protein n=1 Tax=Roseimaritima multifibrata TaxID=1930274 RepID=UPI001FEAA7D3|nr:hypothetical protein [Roseimaritima multifibrata]
MRLRLRLVLSVSAEDLTLGFEAAADLVERDEEARVVFLVLLESFEAVGELLAAAEPASALELLAEIELLRAEDFREVDLAELVDLRELAFAPEDLLAFRFAAC